MKSSSKVSTNMTEKPCWGACPHQHFRASPTRRDKLSPKDHIALLATPRGYRWHGELPPAYSGPKAFSLLKQTRKRIQDDQKIETADQRYLQQFLSQVLPIMSPEMINRLKRMLVMEFGMSPKEAEDLIRSRKSSKNKLLNDIEVSIKAHWLKEFERLLTAKITDYMVSMMCARRSKRVQTIAENLLSHICDITDEWSELGNPQNRIQRIQVFLVERFAVWLANSLGKADKAVCEDFAHPTKEEIEERDKNRKRREELDKKRRKPYEEKQRKEQEEKSKEEEEKQRELEKTEELEKERQKELEEEQQKELEEQHQKELEEEQQKELEEQQQKELEEEQQKELEEQELQKEAEEEQPKEEEKQEEELEEQTPTVEEEEKVEETPTPIEEEESIKEQEEEPKEEIAEETAEEVKDESQEPKEEEVELLWLEPYEEPCAEEEIEEISELEDLEGAGDASVTEVVTEEQKALGGIDEKLEKSMGDVALQKEESELDAKEKKMEIPCPPTPRRTKDRAAYRLKKIQEGCYYKVKNISDNEVCALTRVSRSKKRALMPESICRRPVNAKPMKSSVDMKEWVKWATDVVDFADKWCTWISQTTGVAEAKATQKDEGDKEKEKNWRKVRKEAEIRSLELKRNKKYVKETSKLWAQKLKNVKEAEKYISNQSPTESNVVYDAKVSVKTHWLKEFERLLTAKITDYMVSMMCARRSKRVQTIAENLLSHICDITQEWSDLDNPQNRMQRIQVFLAERFAVWLSNLLGNADKEICKDSVKHPPKRKEKTRKTKHEKSELRKSERESRREELEEKKRKELEEKKRKEEEEQRLKEEEEQRLKEEEEQRLKEEEEEPSKEEEEQPPKEEEEQAPKEEEEEPLKEEPLKEEEEQPLKEEEEQKLEEPEPSEEAPIEAESELKEENPEGVEEPEPSEEAPIEAESELKEEKPEGVEEPEPSEEAPIEAESELEEEKPEEMEAPEPSEAAPIEAESELEEEKPEEMEADKVDEHPETTEEEEEPKDLEERPEDTLPEEEPKEPMGVVEEWIEGTEPIETDRQQALSEILEDELKTTIGDVTPEEEQVIKEVSQKASSFVDQATAEAEKLMEDKEKEAEIPCPPIPPKPKSRLTYHVKKIPERSYYSIKQIDEQRACDLTRIARSKKIGLLPESICERPKDLKKIQNSIEMKEWAKWASDVVDLAEKWSEWISKTSEEAESKAANEKGGEGRESKREAFKREEGAHALELLRNKKYVKDTSKMWTEKLKSNE